ncbi:metal-dependent hydrolase [Actinomyces gaoshouyii]|uniref:metal-dependent hydrolase n=1 Tax=Actinomyces gaoshouyii TaxID=1960083 RepID=UPI0009C1A332|nr:metal-dependent hydrolase [Actinomyces gaoshouyii]ARD42530.1 hypothetical protein B6G06_09385 [Actinomyces gaoshouyii]
MARNHAVSGAAAGVALFSTLSVPLPDLTIAGYDLPDTLPLALGLGQMDGVYTALMCLTMAVAALLPDWDTPSSYVSTCLPPLTGVISRLLARPGHRTLTHSLAGILLACVMSAAVSAPTVVLYGLPVRPGNGLLLALLAALAARTLGASSPRLLWGAGGIGLVWGATLPATALWFMPAAVALGMWVHRAGDALTTRGVEHPLWPLVRRPRLRLPLLGDAGSRREDLLGAALGLYTALGAAAVAVWG